MERKIFELENEELKDLLWKLMYDPASVLQEIDEDISQNDFFEMLVNETRKESRNLHFAAAEPILSTHRVDLGIKNPIVRDVVIERCYKAVFEEGREIEKAIKLLKTEDDGSELSSRRFFGGLKSIGFSNEEANYLKETCILYPISLLLDRLTKELNRDDTKCYSAMVVKNEGETTTDIKILNNTKVTALDIIEDGENINIVLEYCSKYEVTDLKQILSKIEQLECQIKSLNTIYDILKDFQKKGITLDYILSKKDPIEKILQLSKEL